MNTLGQKIKMLRDREGMNVSDFAKAIGVSHVSVLNWEKGETRNMKLESLLAISKFGKIGIDELVSDEPLTLSEKSVNEVTFDVLNVRAACGNGIINPDYPEIVRRMVMPIEKAMELIGSINKNGNIKVIVASKDSMVPTINPNDLLFIDTSVNDFAGESVYVILHGGELLCKRISLIGRNLTVISDNKNYDLWLWVERPDETRIVGKVLRALPMDFKNFGN